MTFGGTVVTAVLGPAIGVAVQVVVAQVPSVTRSDQLTAAPAGDGARLDELQGVADRLDSLATAADFSKCAQNVPTRLQVVR